MFTSCRTARHQLDGTAAGLHDVDHQQRFQDLPDTQTEALTPINFHSDATDVMKICAEGFAHLLGRKVVAGAGTDKCYIKRFGVLNLISVLYNVN